MLQELCKYIENNTALTLGTDLFCGPFPPNAQDSASSVVQTGGYEKTWTQNRVEKRFQVLTRDTDHLAALAASKVIYDALRVKGEVSLPVVNSGVSPTIEVIHANAPPQYVGPDATERRHLFSVNYVINEK